jgi:hypothetical protein
VLRLAVEVRELFRVWGAPVRVVGTVLGLREEPLRARLWRDVLTFLPLAPLAEQDAREPDAAGPQGALPALLDRLAQLASRERSFLLDPRYQGMVAEPLRDLRQALVTVGTAVDALPRGADPALLDQAANVLRAFGWDRASDQVRDRVSDRVRDEVSGEPAEAVRERPDGA